MLVVECCRLLNAKCLGVSINAESERHICLKLLEFLLKAAVGNMMHVPMTVVSGITRNFQHHRRS